MSVINIFGIFRLCIFLLFTVLSLLSADTNDSAYVADLAEEGGAIEGSYGMMALIFGLIPSALQPLTTYFLGAIFIYVSTRNIHSNAHAAILAVLVVAPSLLTIGSFQKDLILAPLIALCAFTFSSARSVFFKIAVVATIYVAYALTFRLYYVLIFMIFSFILFYRHATPAARVFLVALCILVLALTPVSAWVELQGVRDDVNNIRKMFNGLVGARTAFFNPWPIDGFIAFALNYGYAFLRLNLPFFFSFGPNELFLFVNVATYTLSVFWGLRYGTASSVLASALILAHALVLFLFEPDLGSYIRHLSITLPLLAVPLSDYFRRHPWTFAFRAPS